MLASHIELVNLILLTFSSGELDMTVNLLIQVDKLVQLIESPVFTCEFRRNAVVLLVKHLAHASYRLEASIARTRKVPIPI
jgi:hypothetical protein